MRLLPNEALQKTRGAGAHGADSLRQAPLAAERQGIKSVFELNSPSKQIL
ncbi:MAG TPA: hypothetical protein VFN58_02405 [Candidatus Binatia bacterium]|jgi:hypothetical protein|nr:hypothetical protein [Candidatus Binatia bacterium]